MDNAAPSPFEMAAFNAYAQARSNAIADLPPSVPVSSSVSSTGWLPGTGGIASGANAGLRQNGTTAAYQGMPMSTLCPEYDPPSAGIAALRAFAQLQAKKLAGFDVPPHPTTGFASDSLTDDAGFTGSRMRTPIPSDFLTDTARLVGSPFQNPSGVPHPTGVQTPTTPRVSQPDSGITTPVNVIPAPTQSLYNPIDSSQATGMDYGQPLADRLRLHGLDASATSPMYDAVTRGQARSIAVAPDASSVHPEDRGLMFASHRPHRPVAPMDPTQDIYRPPPNPSPSAPIMRDPNSPSTPAPRRPMHPGSVPPKQTTSPWRPLLGADGRPSGMQYVGVNGIDLLNAGDPHGPAATFEHEHDFAVRDELGHGPSDPNVRTRIRGRDGTVQVFGPDGQTTDRHGNPYVWPGMPVPPGVTQVHGAPGNQATAQNRVPQTRHRSAEDGVRDVLRNHAPSPPGIMPAGRSHRPPTLQSSPPMSAILRPPAGSRMAHDASLMGGITGSQPIPMPDGSAGHVVMFRNSGDVPHFYDGLGELVRTSNPAAKAYFANAEQQAQPVYKEGTWAAQSLPSMPEVLTNAGKYIQSATQDTVSAWLGEGPKPPPRNAPAWEKIAANIPSSAGNLVAGAAMFPFTAAQSITTAIAGAAGNKQAQAESHAEADANLSSLGLGAGRQVIPGSIIDNIHRGHVGAAAHQMLGAFEQHPVEFGAAIIGGIEMLGAGGLEAGALYRDGLLKRADELDTLAERTPNPQIRAQIQSKADTYRGQATRIEAKIRIGKKATEATQFALDTQVRGKPMEPSRGDPPRPQSIVPDFPLGPPANAGGRFALREQVRKFPEQTLISETRRMNAVVGQAGPPASGTQASLALMGARAYLWALKMEQLARLSRRSQPSSIDARQSASESAERPTVLRIPAPHPRMQYGGATVRSLPRLRGKSVKEVEDVLTNRGFTQTHISANVAGNQTWRHADGSEVLIHPYGNQNTSVWKTANNAHIHKNDYDASGNKIELNDRGLPDTDPNAFHVGIANPHDLPVIRGRPHGTGSL